MPENAFNFHPQKPERVQPDLQHGGWQPPASAAKCLHILVVDDNEDAAECLAMLLRIEGHDART
ncbi:MAG TPA: hypothetical protein VFR10_12500, partial [bacterium]|nr:hypothetical protein [bacterium]